MKINLIKSLFLATVALLGIEATAQDQLAKATLPHQRLKKADVTRVKASAQEGMENSIAASLYTDWNTQHVHAYSNAQVPDTFRIDLRGFVMPTDRTKVTSKCGPRWGRMHQGLDIKVYIGDTIKSAFDGRVRIVAYEGKGYGKYVVVRHENGLETVYGHLSKQIVQVGDYIKAGTPIGLGGNTGRSTGSHLHFETRVLGQVINPEFLFDFPQQDIVADSYLFIKGANMTTAQRTRALAQIGRGEAVKVATESAVLASSSSSKAGAVRKTYRVKKGDTLASIAKKHGITVNKLCRLNNIKTTTKVQRGRILRCS